MIRLLSTALQLRFGSEVSDGPPETRRICLHNTAQLLSMCFGEKLSCGREREVLITMFPRRGIQTERRWIRLRSQICSHDRCVHYTPLRPDEISCSCQTVRTLEMFLRGTELNQDLYFLIRLLVAACCPVLPPAVCRAAPASPRCRAGWVVQQLGMWRWRRLCFSSSRL